MNKFTKASYTIEASFIMPIVLFTIISLIYLSFYLHDYNKLLTTIDEVTLKASWHIRHNADITTGEIDYNNLNSRAIYWRNLELNQEKRIIEDYLIETINKGLFITKTTTINIIESIGSVRINIAAESSIPFGQVKKLFTKSEKIRINIEAETEVHEAAEFIRIADLLTETATSIKGVDEIINNLKGLLERMGTYID